MEKGDDTLLTLRTAEAVVIKLKHRSRLHCKKTSHGRQADRTSLCFLHGLDSATSQEFFMNPCRASRDATPCWHDTVEIQMMKKGPSDGGIFLFYPSKVELAVGVHKIQTCNAVYHRVFRFPRLSSISSAYSVPGRNLMPKLLLPGQSCLGVHPGDLFRQSIDAVFHFLRNFIILTEKPNMSGGSTT